MAGRRYRRRRRPETIEDILAPLFGLLSLGLAGYIFTHRNQILFWGVAILGLGLIVSAVLLVLRKRKRQTALNWDDDKILYMLKGMSPAEFEQEMAEVFQALGYDAQVVGGANDGGIDVVCTQRRQEVLHPAQEVHDARGNAPRRTGFSRRDYERQQPGRERVRHRYE